MSGDVLEDRELSQAILEYVGKGRSAFPRSDDDAVVKFAADTGAEPAVLLAQVVEIASECLAVTIDWSTHTLSEGGDEAERVMAERHPELGRDALKALRWAFTYNWR